MVPAHTGYNILPNTVCGHQGVLSRAVLTRCSLSSVDFFDMRAGHLRASRLTMLARTTRGRTWSSSRTC
jgi:hypothetical protein